MAPKTAPNPRKRKQTGHQPQPNGTLALTKEDVKQKISSNELQLVSRASDDGCDIWQSFSAVRCPKTNSFLEYVQCNSCEYIYSFKKGSSPSTLQRHKCKVTDKVAPNQTAKVTSETKDSIKKGCVRMCAQDLRPFSVVKGAGFRYLAQQLLDVGAQYAKSGRVRVAVNDVLPDPSTISRNVSDAANQLREEFTPELKESLNNMACAFDADLWTDQYTKTHYLTITSQYIRSDWTMKSKVLCTSEFPADEAKTGLNIRKEIVNEMKDSYGIGSEDLDRATFVTDQGSNMLVALSVYRRLPCSSHLLATVLRHTLDEEKFLKSNAVCVYDLLKTSRGLVNYLKRSGLSRLLPSTVKLMADTRWNTVVDMIESIANVMPEITQILLDRRESSRLLGWDGELATELIVFLTKFKEVSVELQAKKHPTIQSVLVRFNDLVNHCSDWSSKSDEMQIVMKRALAFLLEKFKLQDEHYIASFLCPCIRTLKELPENEVDHAHELVKQYSRALEITVSLDVETAQSAHPTPSKQRRYGNWNTDPADEDESTSIDDEIKLYLATGKSDTDDPAELLSWWKGRGQAYPKLARLARRILAIPATSASSERNFSRAGLIITEKRSSISPSNVNDLLIMHNYYLDTESSKEPVQLDDIPSSSKGQTLQDDSTIQVDDSSTSEETIPALPLPIE